MSTTTPSRVLAALLIALVSAGCASGGGTATSGAGDSARSGAVTIDDLDYQPADLEVSAGAEVTWTNDDDAPHTVTFDDDAVGSSDQLDTGDTFSTTFAESGTYSYFCALHPDMKGEVTVS